MTRRTTKIIMKENNKKMNRAEMLNDALIDDK
jgi:hypothetical protein